MRNSRAKKLRRLAEKMTTGKPDVAYQKVFSQVILRPDCTRAVYKQLKKSA